MVSAVPKDMIFGLFWSEIDFNHFGQQQWVAMDSRNARYEKEYKKITCFGLKLG